MFNAKTVFIIGAGASCHYGYPTGEELVRRVQKKASAAWTYFDEASINPWAITIRPDYVKRIGPDIPPNGAIGLKQQMRKAMDDCRDLASRLRNVDPLVIDYFIGQNRQLEGIAKLCIAWDILQSEAAYEARILHNQLIDNNNWCRFIIHKLVAGCAGGPELLQNNVRFITFNYDISLEKQLRRGLASLQQFEDVAEEFLNGDRILHVYGKIREKWEMTPKIDWHLAGTGELEKARNNPESKAWDLGKTLLDIAFASSKGIKIIAPDKAETNPEIEKAKEVIAQAECLYILGYGFDGVNNKLLDLPNSLRARNVSKTVMFTNYNNRGVVNKSASRMFFNGNANMLLEERGQVVNAFLPFLCEKSIGNVYEALAYDFDAPEERPRS